MTEPMYLVIARGTDAAQKLRQWANSNRVKHTIQGNRLGLLDDHSLTKFQMTWPHSWDTVTVWDSWNKRHINNA